MTDIPNTSSASWVVDFAAGSRQMRDRLGGKGANVAEMTRVLGAERVPAGFTITTEACVAYMRGDGAFPGGLDDEIAAALDRLETQAGRRLGDPADPLLVSVRSGARESMPGMLDTVLNLGLNDETVAGLAQRTGNERFAWDSYRRFVQMYGNVVLGVPGERFEQAIAASKAARGVALDTELDAEALIELTREFQRFYEFPSDPREQLAQAIRAVFDSWQGERALAYRRINRIPDEWGTAVNVQQMVFGNLGESSGSGVAFSRDEVTGAPEPSGDFLANAQGEDVVSGVRTPRDIRELSSWLPDVHRQLMEILQTLERHYGDMQDTEFTVQDGRLYMLQTRNAKRPAQAAVRFAVDAVSEGLLDRSRAISTIDPSSLDALLHPTFDPGADYAVIATGVAASPGAAKGEIVLSAADAVSAAAQVKMALTSQEETQAHLREIAFGGRTHADGGVRAAEQGSDVVLVRPFTEADDVAGFHAARGILTSEGGKASHAALVARGMGRPAVTGAGDVQVDVQAGEVRVNGHVLRAGDPQTGNNYASALGGVHDPRARDLLWDFVNRNALTEQSLIAITWFKNPADLPRLATLLEAPAKGDAVQGTYFSLPYAIYRAYGDAALPVLESAIQKSGYIWIQTNCARELVQAGRRSGFAFIALAIEQNKFYRREMVQFVQDRFPELRGADESKVLVFLKARQ